MAETIKSVLFVDYDSIHRSLAAENAVAAERLAPRLAEWVGAVESGKLFASDNDKRRRLLIRRCYADPGLLGEHRAGFLSNGFQVVDCPPAEGRERNAAAIHMVLDAVDALDHPTGYEEFVFLSADSDLSPILIRLRAHNRTSAIYANAVTAGSYKAIADALIDQPLLVELLIAEEQEEEKTASTEEAETAPQAPAAQADRSEIEALARKINAATSVPLLAPRSFADLFRLLVEEISSNGYHFQTTAENVAQRMSAAGRSATRRQVVFVVKGLALRGHVFSANDTPERLAEVFREQVLYLAENAGVELGDHEKEVLSSWIIGRMPAPTPVPPVEKKAEPDVKAEPVRNEAEAKPAPTRTVAPPAQKPAEETPSGRNGRRRSARAAAKTEVAPPAGNAPKPAPEPAKKPEPAKPAPESSQAAKATGESSKDQQNQEIAARAKPDEPQKPAAPARSVLLKSSSAAKLGPLPSKPQIMISRPGSSTSTAPVRPTPPAPADSSGSSAVLAKAAAAAATAPTRTPAPVPAARAKSPEASATDADKNMVENSILAAIAQAVDVLVEDDAGEDDESGERETRDASDTAAKAEEAEDGIEIEDESDQDDAEPEEGEDESREEEGEEEEAPESDDIGDEIQRIIASYNRDRKQNEAG